MQQKCAWFYASIVFILLLFSTHLLAQLNFKRHTIDSNLSSAHWVYSRDIDRDGDMDLVTASQSGIHWWKNNGRGSFSKQFVGSLNGAWTAYADDIDRDGRIDILGGSPMRDEVLYWRNNGGQSFTKIIADNTAQDPETVVAADMDGDGDDDILVSAWIDGQIVLFKNTGGGNFSKHVIDSNMSGAHSVAVGDLDGDGDNDIAASTSGKTRWYKNDGRGNFSSRTIDSQKGLSLFVVDLNKDGEMDILRSQGESDGSVDWFKNTGGGNFSKKNIEGYFGKCWSIVAGDVDGDGDIDVSGASMNLNMIKVWYNDGSNRFTQSQIVESVDTPRSVYIADLDGDGDGDIASAILGAKDLVWYEVLGSSTNPDNTPPVISSVSVSNVGVNSITINWITDEVSDSQVEYGVDTGYGSMSTLQTGLVTNHSVDLIGLTPNTTYHYRVLSRDGSRNRTASGDFSFTTDIVDFIPPVISNITVENVNSMKATIIWDTDENADSQVEYGTTTMYGNVSALQSDLVSSHSVSLTGLTANTTYHYRILSKDGSGNLSKSADFNFTTLGAYSLTISARVELDPYKEFDFFTFRVFNNSDVAAITQIELSSSSDRTFDIFKSGSDFTVSPDIAGNNDDNRSAAVTLTFASGLQAGFSDSNGLGSDLDGDDRNITVTVYFDDGNILKGLVKNIGDSDDDNPLLYVFDSTGNSTPDTTPPVISKIVVNNISATGATIGWTTDEVSDSQVEYGLDAGYGNMSPLQTGLVTSHTIELSGLTPNTTYHSRVLSRDGKGNLSASSDVSFATLENGKSIARVRVEIDPYNEFGFFTFRVFNNSKIAKITSIDLTAESDRTFDIFKSGSNFTVSPDIAGNNDDNRSAAVTLIFSGDGLDAGSSDANDRGSDLDGHDRVISVVVHFNDGTVLSGLVNNVGDSDDNNTDLYVFEADNAPALTSLQNKKAPQIAQQSFAIEGPTEFALFQNYPNPFNPETQIRFQSPISAFVKIRLFNIIGHEVKTLVNEQMGAGSYTISWDGTDNLNQPVSSGIYLVSLRAGNYHSTIRMMLLK